MRLSQSKMQIITCTAQSPNVRTLQAYGAHTGHYSTWNLNIIFVSRYILFLINEQCRATRNGAVTVDKIYIRIWLMVRITLQPR